MASRASLRASGASLLQRGPRRRLFGAACLGGLCSLASRRAKPTSLPVVARVLLFPLVNWFQRWCSPRSTAAPPDETEAAMASKTQKASTRTLNPAEDTYTISEEYYKVDQGTLGGFRPDKKTRIFAFFAAADFSILAKKRAVASQRCPFLVFRLYLSRPQACRHASVPDTVPDALTRSCANNHATQALAHQLTHGCRRLRTRNQAHAGPRPHKHRNATAARAARGSRGPAPLPGPLRIYTTRRRRT